MAHYTKRCLDEKSTVFLEELGLSNVDHTDPHHSVWRGSYGTTPFNIYIPLGKNCTTIGELLYYVRGDGIGMGIKMEREKLYNKIKNNMQNIIFGDRFRNHDNTYSNKRESQEDFQDSFEGRSDGGDF